MWYVIMGMPNYSTYMQMVSSPNYKAFIAQASWEANIKLAGAWKCPEDNTPRNQMGMSYGLNYSIANVARRVAYWASGGNVFWTMNKFKAPSRVFLIADANRYAIQGDSETYWPPAYRHGATSFNMLMVDGHTEGMNRNLGQNWQASPFTDYKF